MSVLSKPLAADHLLAIFTRVPIGTLLRLPLVCTAWSSLQPIACRHTHTLSLNITDENFHFQRPFTNVPLIGFLPIPSPLSIPHSNGTLPPPVVLSLLSLFPFIRTLLLTNSAFVYNNAETLPPEASILSLTRLLHGWTASLTRLAIFGFNDSLQFTTSTSLRCLLSAINRLHFLRHLTLDVDATFLPADTPPSSLRLSVLSRLQSFTFKSLDQAAILLPSMQVYGNMNILTELRLPSHVEHLLLSLAQQGSPYLGRITSCGFSRICSPESPALLGAHLRSLTTLKLVLGSPGCFPLRRHLNCLAQCPQLHTLQLIFTKLGDAQVNPLALPEIRPFPLLTTFKLFIFVFTSHRLLLDNHLPLGALFPALTSFTLKALPRECTHCGTVIPFRPSGYSQEEQSTMRTCVRLCLEPLKVCKQLKKITIPNFADEKIQRWHVQTWEDFPLEKL